MCPKDPEIKKSVKESILEHLTQWKPVYELAAIVSVIAAIIFGYLSIKQTQKSIDVAIQSLDLLNKSFELQEQEFRLKNRPIVLVGSVQFAGSTTDANGKNFPRSIKIHLKNISDVPATEVQATFTVFLNGRKIGSIELSPPTAVAKNAIKYLVLGMSEDLYNQAIDQRNNFETKIEVTYSGMLGEKSDQYLTKSSNFWSVKDSHFMDRETLYK
jgi:hypothetical protein